MFFGTPVCGACKAEQRIAGLLKGGRFLPSQQERVVAIIRGAEGALSDLVEDADLFRGTQASLGLPQEETRPPTSGAPPPPKEVEEKDKKEATSSSSYEEREEEEAGKEEDVEVVAERAKATPVKARPVAKEAASGSLRPPEPAVGPKASSKGEGKGSGYPKGKGGEEGTGKGGGKGIHPALLKAPKGRESAPPPLPPPPEPPGGEGSAGLGQVRESGTETLGLTTAAKASSLSAFEGLPKSAGAAPSHGSGGHRHHGESRSSGVHRERRGRSPEPLERRRDRGRSKSKDRKKRRKPNKGKAKRQRGQDFKQWREERREKKKREE